MKKCLILLPTNYNDGRPVEEYKIENVLNRISDLIGGYTIDGKVEGAFRMADGTVQREVSWKVWAVCDESKLNELRKLVNSFVAYFAQECMYFEIQNTQVEFVTG